MGSLNRDTRVAIAHSSAIGADGRVYFGGFGELIEVAPGRLLGLTTEREQAKTSILYGVDVSTSAVLFRKTLPSPVSTDAYWPHWVDPSYEHESLTLGPDGFVWTYLKDVLVGFAA